MMLQIVGRFHDDRNSIGSEDDMRLAVGSFAVKLRQG
jgi:hypothetical protein